MTLISDLLPEPVRIIKIVHGGQGFGTLSDGKKVFVWNALPGEIVRIRVIKQYRSYVEAIAVEVVEASYERREPIEANYLATSPWQVMTFEAENRYKRSIVEELLQQSGIHVPFLPPTIHDNRLFRYRNKMEYSFWGDDVGLHLALYRRGTHGKQIVDGSELAVPALDAAARSVCMALGNVYIRAGEMKTLIARCNQAGEAVVALFVKTETFPKMTLPAGVKGLRVYYSNPKSPASVRTKLLYECGDCRLQDTLLGQVFTYDSDSFFQINVPVFEIALRHIATTCQADNLVDMYAGVGAIGLSVANRSVELIELDPATAAMARINACASRVKAQVVESSTEKVLEYITADKSVIFDPPRAGLHDRVVTRVLETLPPKIVYLSCNPATQVRDLAKLQFAYDIESMTIFNFFPRTPHIETLAILNRKN